MIQNIFEMKMLEMTNVERESSVIACYFKNSHDFGVNAQLFLSSEYEFSHEAYFPGDYKEFVLLGKW